MIGRSIFCSQKAFSFMNFVHRLMSTPLLKVNDVFSNELLVTKVPHIFNKFFYKIISSCFPKFRKIESHAHTWTMLSFAINSDNGFKRS